LARRRRGQHIPFHYKAVNFVPFRNKLVYLSSHGYLLKSSEWYNFYSDLAGNILLFLPMPLCIIYCTALRNPVKIVMLSALISFFIETIQFVSGIGIADIDDLILNTAGACIGLFLLKALRLENITSTQF
jgi:glycopeptide antibiotics resistance protein